MAPLLTGVPRDTVEVASRGYLIGEHGQVPHLLAAGGLIALILFIVALVGQAMEPLISRSQALGFITLAAAATTFATEPSLLLETRSMGFVAILLLVGYYSSPEAPPSLTMSGVTLAESRDHDQVIRHFGGISELRALSFALLTAAALAGCALLPYPQQHTAHSQVLIQPTRSEQSLTYDSQRQAATEAAAYRQLLLSDSVLRGATRKMGNEIVPDQLRDALAVPTLDYNATTISFTVASSDEHFVIEASEALGDSLVENIDQEKSVASSPQAEGRGTVTVIHAIPSVSIAWPRTLYIGFSLLLAILLLANLVRQKVHLRPRQRQQDLVVPARS